MKIEILGSGCGKCKSVEKLVRNIVEELGIQADIVKVEDLQEIVNRGIMMTPAVFIDGEAKIVGRVPTADELKKLLR
ncbi:MAG: TM0996/MTH895 family glutaredoxin-like protein [Candidatus Thermoplasmatota archaeon]|nr:TM0996/MTH895 family glutaredoxin-like protein [Candidatus Thermoplasmatota archaeon]MBU1862829.1 TM0996/MTH895 family glutaredoxin-like protein [Candidatus Omnitrophota bacterium]